MDIIWAIRELCKGDKGFENMFDKSKSGGKLASLTGGNRDAEPFNDTVKNLMLNKKVKCPKCGSENVVCLDGSGAITKCGDNVMIDIAPDMWLCQDCKESFRIEDTE